MSTESMNEASQARLTDLQIAERLVEQAKADAVELVGPLNCLTKTVLQPVSNLDPIALGQVAAADGRVYEFQLPASMNHNDPQLGDTPTLSAAAWLLAPCRSNTKNRRLVSGSDLFHAQRDIEHPLHQDSLRSLETARYIRWSSLMRWS